jgi:hypothetical protein
MEPLGTIRADEDPPGVSKERWVALIHEHPNLAVLGPREGINPFNREREVYHPRRDAARVLAEGEEVGAMNWCESDENEINIFGDRVLVVPVAQEIAARLGARFVEDD